MNTNLRIRDCLGIAFHPHAPAYSADLDALIAIAVDIGFKWVRSNSNSGSANAKFHAAGLNVLNVFLPPNPTTPISSTIVNNVIATLNPQTDAIELFNEPSATGAGSATDSSATGANAQNQTIINTNAGRMRLLQSSLPNNNLTSAANLATTAGYVSSGNATYTATTVTPATSPGWTVNQWVGQVVVAGSVWAVVTSNTASALTVAAPWFSPAGNPATPASNTQFAIIGDFTSGVHATNVHLYRGMRTDAAFAAAQAQFLATATAMGPQLPWWVTEGGYHNYQVPGQDITYKGPENGNHQATPEAFAAVQIIPHILSWFALGATRVFLYELRDEIGFDPFATTSSPPFPTGQNDHEARFGLINADMSYKAQAIVLKNWLARYGDLSIGQAFALKDSFGAPMLVEYSGTQAATPGTEHTLAVPTAAPKTRALIVDVSALSGAETVTLRIKGPVLAAGTSQVINAATFGAGIVDPNTQSPPVLCPQGATFTLQQTGGTGRSYPWSIITLD